MKADEENLQSDCSIKNFKNLPYLKIWLKQQLNKANYTIKTKNVKYMLLIYFHDAIIDFLLYNVTVNITALSKISKKNLFRMT